MALDGGAIAYELYCSKLRGVIRYAWHGEEPNDPIWMKRGKTFRDYVASIADPKQAELMGVRRPSAGDAAKSIKFKGTPDGFDKRATEAWERLRTTYLWALLQVLPPAGAVGIVVRFANSYLPRLGVEAENDLWGPEARQSKECGNSLLHKLGLARKWGPRHPAQFETAAAAIQLDACLALMSGLIVDDERYKSLCSQLVCTVAGAYGRAVLRYLENYCGIRERSESVDAVSRILLAASMYLQESWSGDPADALYSAPYVPAAIDLIWQAKVANDDYLTRTRSGRDWPIPIHFLWLDCFLSDGRRRMAQWLQSVVWDPYPYMFV
jgi:hypothetical protein